MNEAKKLFAEIDRDYTGPASYAESMFDFLNRSARSEYKRIHNLLEQWFEDFPSEIHPIVSNRVTHSDFKVLKDGKPLFYLEAALAALSDTDTHKTLAEMDKNEVK